MTSNISYKGTDLDSIYEVPRLGAPAPNTNISSQIAAPVSSTIGDIATRYSAIAASSVVNGNIATRIPPTGIITSAGTDLSSIFVGNPGQYTVSTGLNPSHTGFASPITLTHTFTVTFSTSIALTDYFTYGGRIIIIPSQSTGTTADTNLQGMFSQINSFILHDTANYITGPGTGVILNNQTIGGQEIGTTQLTLITATEPTLYTSNTYVIKVQADAGAGLSRILTFQIVLTIAQHGTITDTYTGTYRSTIDQRNYSGVVTPIQPVPTFLTTIAP